MQFWLPPMEGEGEYEKLKKGVEVWCREIYIFSQQILNNKVLEKLYDWELAKTKTGIRPESNMNLVWNTFKRENLVEWSLSMHWKLLQKVYLKTF